MLAGGMSLTERAGAKLRRGSVDRGRGREFEHRRGDVILVSVSRLVGAEAGSGMLSSGAERRVGAVGICDERCQQVSLQAVPKRNYNMAP